jgi:hypothetical protein
MKVLFDVTRLQGRLGRAAPTGIDRVDLAYARALSTMEGVELGLVSFDLLQPRLLAPGAARQLLALAERTWEAAEAPSKSRGAPADSPAFGAMRTWLQSKPSPSVPAPRLAETATPAAALRRSLRDWLRVPLELAALRRFMAGEPTVYLNTSHGRLYRGITARWLKASGVIPVFFVHDLIPILYPQYNRPTEPARHAARLKTVAVTGRAVLVNSLVTRR